MLNNFQVSRHTSRIFCLQQKKKTKKKTSAHFITVLHLLTIIRRCNLPQNEPQMKKKSRDVMRSVTVQKEHGGDSR